VTTFALDANRFTEISDAEGKRCAVQCFQRAEFELHLRNADSSSKAPYNVQDFNLPIQTGILALSQFRNKIYQT
jgi:hypothetical protein